MATTELELILGENHRYRPHLLKVHYSEVARVVLDAARIPAKAQRDVRASLHHSQKEFRQAIWRADPAKAKRDHWSRWREFEASIKSRESFFNQSGHRFLEDVFFNLETRRNSKENPVVVSVDPGKQALPIYRARAFKAITEAYDAWIRPDIDMGPPPPSRATPGRMNAHGVSVFYGSTSKETAVTEVRPPIEGWVAVVRFDIVRPIRLLDIASMQSVLTHSSPLGDGFVAEIEHAAFLKHLGNRIAKPVSFDDKEDEYRATQALCEFFEHNRNPRLDGIVFPSMLHREGKNIVLFRKSARVEPAVFPDGEQVFPNQRLHDAVTAHRRFKKPMPSRSYDARNSYLGGHLSERTVQDSRHATLRADCETFELFKVRRLEYEKEKVPKTVYQSRRYNIE